MFSSLFVTSWNSALLHKYCLIITIFFAFMTGLYIYSPSLPVLQPHHQPVKKHGAPIFLI